MFYRRRCLESQIRSTQHRNLWCPVTGQHFLVQRDGVNIARCCVMGQERKNKTKDNCAWDKINTGKIDASKHSHEKEVTMCVLYLHLVCEITIQAWLDDPDGSLSHLYCGTLHCDSEV